MLTIEEIRKKARARSAQTVAVADKKTEASGVETSTAKQRDSDQVSLMERVKATARSRFSGAATIGDNGNMTVDGFNSWQSGLQGLYQKGTAYLSSDGYRSADTALVDEIDKQLAQATDVMKFIRTNGDRKVAATYSQTVDGLRQLKHDVETRNEFLGQFKDQADYDEWQDRQFHTSEDQYQARLDWHADATERVKTLTGAEKEALEAEIARYERGEGEWATYDEETGLQTGFRNLESDRQLAKLQDKDFVDSAKKTAETSYIPSFEELAEMDRLLYDQNFTMDLGPDGQTVAYSSVDGSQLIQDKDGNFHHALEYDPRYTSIDRLGVYLSADSDQKAKTSLHGAISTWDNIKNQGIANHWDFLTPEEVSVYYGLKAQSDSEADAFLQQMQSTLNHRYENARAKGLVEEYEKSGWLHRLRMQGRTVLEQGVSGIASAVTMLGDAIEGEETDVYGAAFSGARYANTVRGHTAKKLDEAAPDLNVLGLSLGDIYQAGMSGVDSLAVSWIPGGSAVLGTSSAANQAMKLYQEGADQAQILGGAMAAGIVEMAAEAIPLDKLNALKTKDVYTWSDFLLNVAKQAGCEFVEESATEIANGLTDAIIRRSESDWAKLWKENDGNGWKVAGIILGEVLTAGVSGALSGAGTAGVVSVGNAVRGTKQTRNIGRAIKTAKGGVEGMKTYASTVAQNGNNRGLGRFASKLTDKSSAARVGKAYRMTEASVREQNKAELSKTLQEKGYSKKQADQIAEAAVSSAAGWRLTEKQQSIWSAAQSDPDVVTAVKDALTGEDSGVRRRNQMSEDFRQGVRNRNMANSQTVGKATPAKGETAEEAVMKEVRRQMRENGLPVEEASGVEDPSTALRSAQDDSVSQEESDLTSPEMRQTMQEAYANDEITEEEYDEYLDAMIEQQGMDGVVEEEAQLREKAEAVKRAEEQVTAQEKSVLQEEIERQWGVTAPQSAAQAHNDSGNMNGGTDNGTGVLHGSGQRNDRASAGEPAGGLAGRAGQDQARGSTKADRARETVYRQNLKQNLRDEPAVSSRSQGVRSGTDNATFKVVPEDMHSAKMREVSEDAYRRTGKRITYVVGPIEVVGKDGKVHNAKGVTTDDGILVRIDHGTNGDGIAEHEVFHGLMDLWDESVGRRSILDGLMKELRRRYDPEQLRQMLNQYKEALRGIYSEDSGADPSGDVLENVDYDVLEEMLADAYAGLNEHGAGANRLTDTVRTWMKDNFVEQDFFQDNGTEQPTGPPAGQKENTAEHGGERYSVEGGGKIYPGIDEETRTAILSEKVIHVPSYDDSDPVTGAQIIRLKGKYVAEARDLLMELADQCGDFRSDYYNSDVEISFSYSNRSVKESINKQAKRGGGAETFGKMLSVLPEICRNAVEIEAHTDRYTETRREDRLLKEMHVLLSAFSDAEGVVPVQLEIKEFLPKARQANKLYVTVTIKEEAGIASRGSAAESAGVSIHDTPASVISLTDLIRDVKDQTGDLVKYLPDAMLNEEQLQAKKNALLHDEKRLKDMRYEYAVDQNNADRAEQMLREKANDKGYSSDTEWRLSHHAPNAEGGTRMDMADQAFGGDGSLYSAAAQMYYGEGREYDWKAFRAMNKAANNPEAVITVYRAVPNDVRGSHLQNGDWVATTKEYAQEHGERTFDGEYWIVEQNVPAKYLYTDGNSIHEFGYDNGRTDEVYKNTANNVKRARVTYDDAGKLIPLSKRFDESVADERYSVDDSTAEEEQKDSYSTLPAKARDYVRSAERNLLDFVGQALSVPKAARRDFLAQVVRAITNEYLTNGSVSAQTIDSLFQQAYAQGVVADEEFFNQYRHIKEHLRSTAVTLAEQDRGDIADYYDFKRQAGGLLKIRNEGGLPVDVAYQELQDMAPELFPDNITHPADQLVRMLEVAQSIEVSYMSLDRYYGDDAANFKRDAQHEFENAVDKVLGDLRNAKRYMDDRNAERDKAPTTVEEAMEAWKELKAARRNYEKTMAKNLLTEHDQRIVGDLLYGKATLENLDPERDNVKGITAVYEAKREYAKLVSLLAEYKRNLKAELRAEADSQLETANEWKDKCSGLAYSRETMRRNVLDIVKDPEVADKILRKYFEPVAIAEATATRFKDKYRERVAALNLSRKVKKGDTVSEAHAVQLLGEAMDNIAVIESARGRLKHRDGKTLTEWKAVVQELWESSPSLDRAKIEKAVQEFREIYDDLFQQMNQVRVQNGYEPVNYRKGYFPHFQKESTDGILAHFGRALGISTEVAALPTTINGLTHTFRPGIQWFGNALQRTGFATAYDAVEGFDKYIEGVASVIHQTENIQRLRALASQIRYRTSDDGIRARVDKVLQDPRFSEEEKRAQIDDIYKDGKFTLSNFIVELDEYTNLLANKKSSIDRNMERIFGRKSYNFAKWVEQRIGANMIAGNLSSALTNFIPLTQAAARMGNRYMLRGMWNTLKAYKMDDGMVETSTFLTNRRGSDPLVQIWQDKVSSIVGLPMELIDQFVADSIVRGAYYKNLQHGLTEDEAIRQADLFAASVMADRSKGAMPTIFAARNPITKLFTMFQLEVNNQFSEVFKDVPREMRSRGKLALAAKLLQYVLGAFLFNELFEALFGRRPALDPIGILNETVGDFSGYELPNLLELGVGAVTGDMPSFETETAGVQGIFNLGENILGELPFNSIFGFVGIGEDSRIPVESALPDVKKMILASANTEWAAEKRLRTLADEVAKPVTYLALPFGGNQLSKTVKGVIAAVQGGSYTVDNKGRDILQYPVFDDPFSVLRAAIMGKNSVPEGQDWVDDGFDSLSAKATATYQGILNVGVDDREAYALVDELRHAKKTNSKTKEDVQRDILRDSDISAEAKVVAYCGMVATESELKWMNRLLELDPDAQSVFDVAVGLKEAGALKGDAVRQARAEAIADTALTEAQKIVSVESFLGNEWQNEDGKPTTYAKFRDMLEAGLTVDDFMELYAAGADSSDMDKFLGYVDSGLGAHEAMSMLMSVSALKPAEGKTTVSNVQKWRAAVDSQSGTEDQLIALSAVMDEKTYQKVELANEYGVKPDAYVGLREILPKYDEDGNSSYNQKEITAAVNAVSKRMNLTTEQKAVLWQIMASTKSAKNNPYSVEIGWKVVDALSDETLSFGDMFMKQVLAGM